MLATIDYDEIPLDCPTTWDLIGNQTTRGIWQFEGPSGQRWARELKPTNMEELSALNALLRPGCIHVMSGDPPKSTTQRYCDRKNGREEVTYYHPSLEPILKKTYGVLVYQEQAMQIAQQLAGFNLQEADILRKAIGKKKPEIMAKVEKGFLEGCEKQEIVNSEQAKEIFGWIRESQRYSFNKSHAVSYAFLSYRTAYAKAHFKHEFFGAYLKGSKTKSQTREEIRQLVRDAKVYDVEVACPRVYRKHLSFSLDTVTNDREPAVIFGVSDVKNVGEAAIGSIREIMDSAAKPIFDWNWVDFLVYFADSVNVDVFKSLIAGGAFDYLKMPRAQLLGDLDDWKNLTGKHEKNVGRQKHEEQHFSTVKRLFATIAPLVKDGGGCSTKKRSEYVWSLVQAQDSIRHKDTPQQLVESEREMLGTNISCHRVDGYIGREYANCTCRDFFNGACHDGANIAVEVESVREWRGPESKLPMAFVDVSDHTCWLSCVCFARQWTSLKNDLQKGRLVNIMGKMGDRGSLIIEQVKTYTEAL